MNLEKIFTKPFHFIFPISFPKAFPFPFFLLLPEAFLYNTPRMLYPDLAVDVCYLTLDIQCFLL